LPRLSAKEQLILDLLIANRGAMYGLELVANSRSRLKRGTVYVTLARRIVDAHARLVRLLPEFAR
jgi:hypothetical protein